MPVPTANSPIPPEVRPIVGRAHQRFVAACERGERPAIDGPPRDAVALLTALECAALTENAYFPIPGDVLRLGMTPAEHQRQEILDAVAEQLPAAVAAITEIAKP